MEPTTIQRFPQEILSKIFENLEPYELSEAQHVCSKWYRPAHILYLKNVHLKTALEIEQFIESIDHNPDTSYLAAVVSIKISGFGFSSVEYDFDQEDIEKLFCRFPNLTYAQIYTYSSCLEEFTEESCQNILAKCPKLEDFIPIFKDRSEDIYCETMYQMRSLVTVLNLDNAGYASRFGGIINFITRFPRLRNFWGHLHPINKLQNYFTIFEKLSNLTSIIIRQTLSVDHDEEGRSAEMLLARIAEEQRKLIIERFSKVIDVTYVGDHIFCPHSIKFIAKYSPSLKTLKISFNYNSPGWSTLHQQVFLGEMTSMKVAHHADILLAKMEVAVVAECLPTIVQKIFSRLQYNRTLEINSENVLFPDQVSLRLQWPTTKRLSISLAEEHDIYDSLQTLLNTELNDIDNLVFCINGYANYTHEIRINAYNAVFKMIPSLKEATLEIPSEFMDSIAIEDFDRHTGIESLTLRPFGDAKIQSLLDTYAFMFPNLKILNLYNYSGVLNAESLDLFYDLDNYTVERLMIDMTPVKLMMNDPFIENAFFMVQVRTPENTKRYKISVDSFSVVSVDDEEFQNCLFLNGTTFRYCFCVHILVNSVQKLEGCVCNRPVDDGYNEHFGYGANYNGASFDQFVIF